MKNMVCTHWDTLDFDRSFCSAVTAVEFDKNSEKRNSQKGRGEYLFKKILPSKTYT